MNFFEKKSTNYYHYNPNVVVVFFQFWKLTVTFPAISTTLTELQQLATQNIETSQVV